jgi:hypothetical protein
MSIVQKLVTEDSFVNGVFVPAGQLASYDTKQLNGDEPHIHDAGDVPIAVVQMAPISPTGPNPTAPQQISPDTVQGPGGGYFRPGAVIVGERTLEAETRLAGLPEEGDTAESDFAEKLKEAQEETSRLRAELAGRSEPKAESNDDDDLVAGNVADIKASLGEKSNEELEALRAAELDRERPRKGVTDAIKAELAARG